MKELTEKSTLKQMEEMADGRIEDFQNNGLEVNETTDKVNIKADSGSVEFEIPYDLWYDLCEERRYAMFKAAMTERIKRFPLLKLVLAMNKYILDFEAEPTSYEDEDNVRFGLKIDWSIY